MLCAVAALLCSCITTEYTRRHPLRHSHEGMFRISEVYLCEDFLGAFPKDYILAGRFTENIATAGGESAVKAPAGDTANATSAAGSADSPPVFLRLNYARLDARFERKDDTPAATISELSRMRFRFERLRKVPANYRKIAIPAGLRGHQFPVVLDGGINPITLAACTLTVPVDAATLPVQGLWWLLGKPRAKKIWRGITVGASVATTVVGGLLIVYLLLATGAHIPSASPSPALTDTQ